eukprot:5715923-Prymnesium_polylepis.1
MAKGVAAHREGGRLRGLGGRGLLATAVATGLSAVRAGASGDVLRLVCHADARVRPGRPCAVDF